VQVGISECGCFWPYQRGGCINGVFLSENVWAVRQDKKGSRNNEATLLT